MRKYKEDYKDILESSLIIEGTEYGSVETRREECHGYHYIDDVEVDERKIKSVILVVGDFEIDLTGRLTDDELEYFKNE